MTHSTDQVATRFAGDLVRFSERNCRCLQSGTPRSVLTRILHRLVPQKSSCCPCVGAAAVPVPLPSADTSGVSDPGEVLLLELSSLVLASLVR